MNSLVRHLLGERRASLLPGWCEVAAALDVAAAGRGFRKVIRGEADPDPRPASSRRRGTHGEAAGANPIRGMGMLKTRSGRAGPRHGFARPPHGADGEVPIPQDEIRRGPAIQCPEFGVSDGARGRCRQSTYRVRQGHAGSDGDPQRAIRCQGRSGDGVAAAESCDAIPYLHGARPEASSRRGRRRPPRPLRR